VAPWKEAEVEVVPLLDQALSMRMMMKKILMKMRMMKIWKTRRMKMKKILD